MEAAIKRVPGFDDYECETDGTVWSLKHGKRRRLTPQPNQKGQLKVTFRRDGKSHTIFLSHVVLMTFVGPCPPGMEACHDPDHDPTNCRLENIRWDSHIENSWDTNRQRRRPMGSKHYAARIGEAEADEIRRLRKQGMTQTAIAELFSISRQAVGKIVHGSSWRHTPGSPMPYPEHLAPRKEA